MIIVVDFGSQTTHLIGRRIRELGQETKIFTPNQVLKKIPVLKPRGVILSGGPASVYERGAPSIDKKIFSLGIPILGICYGEQLIAHLLDGQVKQGKKKEFGPADLEIENWKLKITKFLPKNFVVWMSHGDAVTKLPPGFVALGKTKTIPYAFIADEKRKVYGVQFHPEVVHTHFGEQILKNFLHVCGSTTKKQNINKAFVLDIIKDIKDSIGGKKAICALSGGVDSTVAALLVHRAIGNHLTAIYIDSGLMRRGETLSLKKVFLNHYQMRIKTVNAQKIFLQNLKEIVNPETKRKTIGETFIKVLEKEAKKIGAQFLVQGTIYPDVIESGGKIKTHHNVAGLPKKMKLALIEPLRNFYKDEVRKMGKILKLPTEIIKRQPFPGPGLAIRIIGEVTKRKLTIVRLADQIVQEEIEKAKLNDKLWQAFAIFTNIKTTGVRGDNRAYGETIAIRAVIAKDAMTAKFARLPYPFLNKISTRIVNEIREVNRVVYDITNKPPATMEWE